MRQLCQRLAAADIEEKAAGEWVTAADHVAERILTAGLATLLVDLPPSC